MTDKNLIELGLLDPLFESLQAEGLSYLVFDRVRPNPTLENADEVAALYKSEACDCFIAFGGGSPIDCAKSAGLRLVRPRTPLHLMQGVLKVFRKIPPIFAVPTTAGTGSEATVATVISNPEKQEKFAISDPALRPFCAVLDPLLTLGLPKHITATTGVDALTHAVEAYVGRSNTGQTRQDALLACRLIFENLPTACQDGGNLVARENMLVAAHHAGLAFTRAYVGYVHAIAHKLGGYYNVPHGLANAVILPYVLEFYGSKIDKQLAQIALAIGLEGPDDAHLARAFIEALKKLNHDLDIPHKIQELKAEDIPTLAKMALKEANPLYPVPVLMNQSQCEDLLKKLLPS
ncbi:MAG: iron-containing alcohol dehydrogenase [Clostridiales bacterium]|nr:iron-containing alcohol dehydrogenase [Clostridiales bacterium]